MKLGTTYLSDAQAWTKAGFELPRYDRSLVAAKTRSEPEWVHFGAGNIFRAFPAAVQQKLLDAGKSETGIIAVEGFDYEVVEKAYRPFDNLSLLVVLKADGTIEKKVIGSVVESLVADSSGADWVRLSQVFTAKSLKMASRRCLRCLSAGCRLRPRERTRAPPEHHGKGDRALLPPLEGGRGAACPCEHGQLFPQRH